MYRTLLLLLILPAPLLLAQTDAEKFAEGRIALDKHNDCPAAKDALESVSPAGRAEPLWLFYTARAYECLHQPDKALPLYEKYNQLMPGQAAILDKIGELRYQVAKTLREREAEEAKQQKLEADRQEFQRLQTEANATLPTVLKNLADEINRHSSWQDGQYQYSFTAGPPSCDFDVTYTSTTYTTADFGTKWQCETVDRSITKYVLDLRHMRSADLANPGQTSNFSYRLSVQSESPLDAVSWESFETRDQTPVRSNNQWCSDQTHHHTDYGSNRGYSLPFPKEVARDDWISLQQAFDSAIRACHLANGLPWNSPK